LRVIGVDPGVRNVYVAYSSDGDIIKMSLGEYHSLAKTHAFEQRLHQALGGYTLPALPVVRSPRIADTVAYAAAVAANLDVLQAAYGDRRIREARLSVRSWPPSAGTRRGRVMRAGGRVHCAVNALGPWRGRTGGTYPELPDRTERPHLSLSLLPLAHGRAAPAHRPQPHSARMSENPNPIPRVIESPSPTRHTTYTCLRARTHGPAPPRRVCARHLRPFPSVSARVVLGALTRTGLARVLAGIGMQLYNARKAALSAAVQRLIDPRPGDRDPRLLLTVVLFGDGNFSPTAGGNRASPYRLVRQALGAVATATVISTDERLTSKVRATAPCPAAAALRSVPSQLRPHSPRPPPRLLAHPALLPLPAGGAGPDQGRGGGRAAGPGPASRTRPAHLRQMRPLLEPRRQRRYALPAPPRARQTPACPPRLCGASADVCSSLRARCSFRPASRPTSSSGPARRTSRGDPTLWPVAA